MFVLMGEGKCHRVMEKGVGGSRVLHPPGYPKKVCFCVYAYVAEKKRKKGGTRFPQRPNYCRGCGVDVVCEVEEGWGFT